VKLNALLKILLGRIESPLLDRVTLVLVRMLFKRKGSIPSVARLILISIWSTDPLRKEKDLPEIDLAIVFAYKDVELVPAAVLAAVHFSANPIKVVRLVTPSLDPPAVQESIGKVEQASLRMNFSLEVYDDASLLGTERLRDLRSHQVPDRSLSWVTQQLLKLSAVLKSSQRATLIVDADTILLKRRTWLAKDGRQILMAPEWFRSLWTEDVERFLGLKKSLPFSFITHHQLMQRNIVETIFGADGRKLIDWALSARRRIAEYETYGTYLAEVHPRLAVVARFGNVERAARPTVSSIDSVEDLSDLSKSCGSSCLSLSVHHYLQDRP